MRHEHDEIDPEIRALYPGKDDAWLAEAQENLRRYAAATMRQYQRIQADPEALARYHALRDELRAQGEDRPSP